MPHPDESFDFRNVTDDIPYLRRRRDGLDARISDLIDMIRQGNEKWIPELVILLDDADGIRQELTTGWQRPPEKQVRIWVGPPNIEESAE